LHSLKMAGNQDSLDSMTFLCCLPEIIATSYSPFESCALFHFVLLLRISVPTFHLSTHHLSASLGNFLMSSTVYVIQDRKSTRLNSSHVSISYAVFCSKK